MECTTREAVEEAIHNEISLRFSRAKSAPMCNGPLFELLGYNADTEAGAQILEGTFVPPPGIETATILILNNIVMIWAEMGEGKVSITITREDFQHYWRRMKERTSLSYSGRHFGHYKAAGFSDYLSDEHAGVLGVITKTKTALGR